MLKFFRKIRQGLINSGDFRKYLLYALGEVILIIIGILIAFQLNSLSESRKLDERRSGLVERLSKQIEINQYQANEAIEELQKQLEDIGLLMSYMGASNAEFKELAVDTLMSSVIEDHHLGLDLTTLEEALDNGEISILDDKALRTSLYSLLKVNERLEQREEIANHDNNNFAIPFLYKHTNSRNTSARTNEDYRRRIGFSKLEPSNFEALFGNREFENLVESRFYYAQEMMTNYQRIASFLEYLDEKIEQ